MIREYASPPEKEEKIERTSKVEEDQSVKKSFKGEMDKIKGLPLGKRIEYLLSYYGLTALFTIIGVTVLIMIITHIANTKSPVMYVNVIAGSTEPTHIESVTEDFCNTADLTKKQTLEWHTGLYEEDMGPTAGIPSKYVTFILVHEVDVIFFDEANYDFVKQTQGHCVPSELLTEEQLSALSDYIYDSNFFDITNTNISRYLGFDDNKTIYMAISNNEPKHYDYIRQFIDLLIQNL